MKGYLYARLISQQINLCLYQRLRKLQNVCNLFSGLYSRSKFRILVSLLINRLNQPLTIKSGLFGPGLGRNGRSLLMLSGVSCQFWQNQGIQEDEMNEILNDFEQLVVDCDYLSNSPIKVDDIKNEDTGDDQEQENDDQENEPARGKLIAQGWEPIILRDHFQVWRRIIDHNGMYQYKVFGTFTDIPAQAFFTVQRDLDYRKSWDQLVIKLEVVDKESDQIKMNQKDHLIDYGNEVVHWIMHYPFPMYSREYCYVRRAMIDYKKNIMILVSRSVDHPDCPQSEKYVRVRDYESQMVIRPHSTFEEYGFDYMLTYFDDPRAAFPNPAYNWMAASGVPSFVESLHKAALQLNPKKEKSPRSSNPENGGSLSNFYVQYISFNRPQHENN